ncbi:hypothetical protein KBC03_07410 [Patescibacteria group bacterium]|nr:hypothetical protein [Patescibacteria group bacterium]
MAQAPIDIHSQPNKPNTPAKSALSYTKEQAKQELFAAIESQNVRFGGWQNTVKERYKEKVEKFKKRGNDEKKAQELATKQIQRVWTDVYKDNLVTPGTKKGNFYTKEGDSDGEGAIFLLRKFVFGKKQSFVHYPSHEEIEKNAQSENLKDKNVIKLFLDGG